ncbi:MAG: septum formation initiator family protein [Parcubacteria group bacterium]
MRKKSFFSILFAVAGIVITGWISYFALKENKRSKQIESEINNLRTEAEKLRENNKAMQDKIVYFETPEFQEKMAKEKLNLQKENENVAIIKPSLVSGSERIAGKTTVAEKEVPKKPNYEKWWDYFFKY